MKGCLPVVPAVLLFAACSDAPQGSTSDARTIRDHVTFYGVGKVARFRQHADASLEDMGPLFFAEIFIAAGGTVDDATVTFPPPVSEVRTLEYRHSESEEIGDVMYLSGLAADADALEASFPTGAYRFSFSTPGGDAVDSTVTFAGASFPRQPVIIFEQDGQRVPVGAVDPSRDLVITWPAFTQGRADPNEILDDLIFVAIDSCTVEDIVHSGRPFEKNNYLTFRASEYKVPAGTLEPGQAYSMYVEHALLPETRDDYGMPAFATLAASTYLDFKTTGNTDRAYCDAAER